MVERECRRAEEESRQPDGRGGSRAVGRQTGCFAGAKGLAGIAQQGITLDDTTNGLAAAAARRGSNGINVD